MRSKARLLLLSAWFIPISIVTFAQAQDPPPPKPLLPDNAASGNLGSYLEGIFQGQLVTCISGGSDSTPKPLTVTKGLGGAIHKQISAIPPILRDPSIKLDDNITIGYDASVARAFAYVYSQQALLTAADSTPDASNYIVSNYLEDPALLTISGLDSAVYDLSCSSALAASMKANSSWSFPPAQVSAAIEADVSSKSTYHLAFVSGTFYSPIWQAYTSTISSDWRAYGRMLVWDWYSRHPGAASDHTTRYLLSQFNGISIYQIKTTSFSTDGQATLNAAVQIPAAATISGSLQASYKKNSTATVNDFHIVVRPSATPGKPDAQFQPVPTLTELSGKIHTFAHAHLDPNTDLHLFKITTHSQVIYGVPQSTCNSTWKIVPSTTPDGTLDFVHPPEWADANLTDSTNPLPPSCKFEISFTLPSPPSPTSREDINYSLTNDVTNDLGNVLGTITIPADTVHLSSSGKPSIDPQTTDGNPQNPDVHDIGATGVKRFTYEWDLSFPVEEDVNTVDQIDHISQNIVAPKISCGGTSVPPTLTATAVYTGGELAVKVTHTNTTNSENIDTTKINVVCTFSGSIQFTLKNSITSTMDFPSTTVFYSPLIPPHQ